MTDDAGVVPEFDAYVDTVPHRDARMRVVVTPDHSGNRSWLAVDGDGLGLRIDMTPAEMRTLGRALNRTADNVECR